MDRQEAPIIIMEDQRAREVLTQCSAVFQQRSVNVTYPKLFYPQSFLSKIQIYTNGWGQEKFSIFRYISYLYTYLFCNL